MYQYDIVFYRRLEGCQIIATLGYTLLYLFGKTRLKCAINGYVKSAMRYICDCVIVSCVLIPLYSQTCQSYLHGDKKISALATKYKMIV